MSGIVGNNTNRSSGLVKAAAVGADSITGSEIADDAIDSEHYTDGSIDNAHIADDAIDSEHYADGSIDNAHIADDAIDSEHYAAASIDNEHLADNAVGTDEIADNAVTLAKMAGGTDGNIISYDASGNPVAIATGTDGQVLTSTGAGSPPAFEAAAAGGALEFIATLSIASDPADVGFSSGIDATRRVYVIYFNDVDISADAEIQAEWYMAGSGGWSGGSAHGWAGGGNNGATIDKPYGSGQARLSHASVDSTNSTSPINGHVYFASGLAGYRPAMWGQMTAAKADTSPGYHHFGGSATNVGVVTGFRLSLSTGTFTTGTLNLYGIKTS